MAGAVKQSQKINEKTHSTVEKEAASHRSDRPAFTAQAANP
jgi:hypothetical protein